MRAHSTPPDSRFWQKVDVRERDECWPWLGQHDDDGYGVFSPGVRWWPKRSVKAHRFAFYLDRGRLPEPYALHSCDNPPCCNPHHLWEGTDADNAADRIAKGRSRYGNQLGEHNGYAKLTEDQVREIRARHSVGGITQAALSAEFGVCRATICNVLKRKLWAHID